MPQHHEMHATGHRIIDLFAGPGGLDVGATWLGIPTTGIELDSNACTTRRAAGLETEQGDVRDYGPAHFPDATVLTGGPPCQTFTVAGKGAGRRALDQVVERMTGMLEHLSDDRIRGWSADERTELILEPMRWALLALRAEKPYTAIVLEQVPAALPIWVEFSKVLENLGYKCAVGVLRAEEYGVPQTRRRAILIARLGDAVVQLPRPTHEAFRKGSPNQCALGLEPCVSMSQALGLPPTFTVISNYGSGGNPRNRGERNSTEPSATVTGKIMRNRLQFAGGDWRRLKHNEAGILQTFPEDYPWAGADKGQQIGNAIPPRLAVHILSQALDIPLPPGELDRLVKSPWTASCLQPIHPHCTDLEGNFAGASV